MFSKKLRCKNCRKLLIRRKLKKGINYICYTKYDDKNCNCLIKPLYENDFVPIVLKVIQDKIGEVDIKIDDMTPKFDELKSSISKCEKNITNREQSLTAIKESGMKLYDNYKDELISKEEFLVRKNDLNVSKIDIEEEVENLKLNLDSLKNEYELLQNSKDGNSNNIITETLNRELVEKYIDCIYVNYDLSLEIEFNETI